MKTDTAAIKSGKKRSLRNRFELMDAIILVILLVWALLIVIPFINVIAISFATPQEYLDSKLLLFPTQPTLSNYKTLFADGRILVGYRTTLRSSSIISRYSGTMPPLKSIVKRMAYRKNFFSGKLPRLRA